MTSLNIPWDIPTQPPAEGIEIPMAERRTNATTITFSLPQIALLVGGAALSAFLTVSSAVGDVKSDIRNLNTLREKDAKIIELQFQAVDAKFAAIEAKAAADAEIRKQMLEKYDKANTDFQRKMLAK